MQKLDIKTAKRTELIDITPDVQEAVGKAKIKEGVCFIFCPHTTAGLAINENADPSVRKDMINTLNKLIPENAGYEHAEGNADAHLKSSLFGQSLTVLVEGGRLALGTWQGVYFCEGDGPRSRQVWVKVI
ncbi:MAG: secondary thiamine-phosphate synthase enzyme YjbQ [Candidatus Omnitrophica bacterium]|nr:secondary thiamine-phosphate synthase enzyme YjbQ [Candidatus Omnitrophota bacterium]